MQNKLKYRLINGKDDVNFCKKISRLLDEGYKLYRSPLCTFNGQDAILSQAVIINYNEKVYIKNNINKIFKK